MKFILNGIVIITLFLMIGLCFNSALAFNLKTDGGLDETAKETGHTTATIVNLTPGQLVGRVIKALLSFLGVVFLMLMIYGGYMWMTAAGNQQSVDKAKKTITSTIIGLIIVMLAYAITLFIGSSLTTSAEECAAGGCAWVIDGTTGVGNCVCAGP